MRPHRSLRFSVGAAFQRRRLAPQPAACRGCRTWPRRDRGNRSGQAHRQRGAFHCAAARPQRANSRQAHGEERRRRLSDHVGTPTIRRHPQPDRSPSHTGAAPEDGRSSGSARRRAGACAAAAGKNGDDRAFRAVSPDVGAHCCQCLAGIDGGRDPDCPAGRLVSGLGPGAGIGACVGNTFLLRLRGASLRGRSVHQAVESAGTDDDARRRKAGLHGAGGALSGGCHRAGSSGRAGSAGVAARPA